MSSAETQTAFPSRSHSSARAVSVAVVQPSQPSTNASSHNASSGNNAYLNPSGSVSHRKARASHTVLTPTQAQRQMATEEQQRQQQQLQIPQQPSGSLDVYSHPAAVAYAAAHPRRQIPKFGPYLLLQTLGEGEFGKVKLGLHCQWGEEVAVKLIRRGHVDSTVRMSKVEREIEVLKTLKHPNIVRLYDVIETDKYIGIVIEYASGGELFDHILAHRYLKERDAAKLFSQLVSGVWYIHQKKIVHRDLKLENLLLDRYRNVIITDFGFANRFEHRSDDLMQTSCGSPCYAAPELVISEGLYVGSAVDIWSCGVILYAMLAGYLPFDDDPANPDGDNINLLYKYIVNTPLSFPDYISTDARDLLSMMLVPDPAHRATLASIMAHPWLALHAPLFQRAVEDLEQAAKEQMEAKRQAYQKQIQAAAAQQHQQQQAPLGRTNSRSKGQDGVKARGGHHPSEYLYETSAEQMQQRRGGALLDDDPFAPAPSADDGKRNKGSASGSSATVVPSATKGGDKKGGAGGFRHTIQVEYDNQPPEDEHMPSGLAPPRRASSKRRDGGDGGDVKMANVPPESAAPAVSASPTRERGKSKRKPSASAAKPLPPPPSSPGVTAPNDLPMSEMGVSPAPTTNTTGLGVGEVPSMNGSMDSQSSKRSKHRKGLSMDRIGLGKIFGVSSPSSPAQPQPGAEPADGVGEEQQQQPQQPPPLLTGSVKEKRPSTLQLLSGHLTSKASNTSNKNSFLLGVGDRGSRRNTLTSMVEPFRSRRGKASRQATLDTPSKEKVDAEKDKETAPSEPSTSTTLQPPPTPSPQTESPLMKGAAPLLSSSNNASNSDFRIGRGISASTNKARKVMQWFRSASRGGDRDSPYLATVPVDPILPLASDGVEKAGTTPTQANFVLPPPISSSVSAGPFVQVTPPERSTTPTPGRAESLASRMRRSVGLPPPAVKGVLRIHHGPLDKRAVTTKLPAEVMKHIGDVLVELGIHFSPESEFKFRCARPKQRRLGIMYGLVAPPPMAMNVAGSAASNGLDKRGLPLPPHPTFGGVGGGMLKGLLMRRQSSQASAGSLPDEDALASPVSAGGPSPTAEPGGPEPIYGEASVDAGNEVRFSVEVTQLSGLQDTLSVDVRRMKGDLRSYKFLYDTIMERANLGEF